MTEKNDKTNEKRREELELERLRALRDAATLGPEIARAAAAATARFAVRLADHLRTPCTFRPCGECMLARCERCGADVPLRTLAPSHASDLLRGLHRLTHCHLGAPAAARARALLAARRGIPDRYLPLRFDGVELPTCILWGHGAHLIRRAQAGMLHDHGVFLTGESGAGKTCLLAAMFGALLDRAEDGEGAGWPPSEREIARAVGARWTTADRLSSAAAAWPRGAKAESPEILEAVGATVLVLDELTDDLESRSAVKKVIFRRYDAGRPTWASTGLTSEAFGAYYGGGTVRRVAESDVIRMMPELSPDAAPVPP